MLLLLVYHLSVPHKMSPGLIIVIVLAIAFLVFMFIYIAKIDPEDGTKQKGTGIQVSSHQTNGMMVTNAMQTPVSGLPIPVTAYNSGSQKSNRLSNLFSSFSKFGGNNENSAQNMYSSQSAPNSAYTPRSSYRNAIAGGILGAVGGNKLHSSHGGNSATQFTQTLPMHYQGHPSQIYQGNFAAGQQQQLQGNDHDSALSLTRRNSGNSRFSDSTQSVTSRRSSKSNSSSPRGSERSRINECSIGNSDEEHRASNSIIQEQSDIENDDNMMINEGHNGGGYESDNQENSVKHDGGAHDGGSHNNSDHNSGYYNETEYGNCGDDANVEYCDGF